MNDPTDSTFSPSLDNRAWRGHDPYFPKQVSIIRPSWPIVNASRQQLRFLSTKGHAPGSSEADGYVD